MKNIKIKIENTAIQKELKTQRRQEMIESGIYGLHKNKTFKDKTKYNRKKNWNE